MRDLPDLAPPMTKVSAGRILGIQGDPMERLFRI
jgi:hypothetical protein